MTGGLSFSGVSLAEALEAEAVFVVAVAILCGVDEEAVTVSISAAARRLLDEALLPGRSSGAPMRPKSDYVPTAKPTTSPPTPRPHYEPTAAPTAVPPESGVVVAYEIVVPSLSEAEAVSSTISSTTVDDVDAAVATAVTANNETLAVVATAVGAADFAATRTRAPTAVPPPGDDASSASSSSSVEEKENRWMWRIGNSGPAGVAERRVGYS